MYNSYKKDTDHSFPKDSFDDTDAHFVTVTPYSIAMTHYIATVESTSTNMHTYLPYCTFILSFKIHAKELEFPTKKGAQCLLGTCIHTSGPPDCQLVD